MTFGDLTFGDLTLAGRRPATPVRTVVGPETWLIWAWSGLSAVGSVRLQALLCFSKASHRALGRPRLTRLGLTVWRRYS